jgi:hypothetical protein
MREERPSLRRAVAALQHREYRLFYIALVVAGIGAQIQTTANIWQIYELTQSPFHLGLTVSRAACPSSSCRSWVGSSRIAWIAGALSC